MWEPTTLCRSRWISILNDKTCFPDVFEHVTGYKSKSYPRACAKLFVHSGPLEQTRMVKLFSGRASGSEVVVGLPPWFATHQHVMMIMLSLVHTLMSKSGEGINNLEGVSHRFLKSRTTCAQRKYSPLPCPPAPSQRYAMRQCVCLHMARCTSAKSNWSMKTSITPPPRVLSTHSLQKNHSFSMISK